MAVEVVDGEGLVVDILGCVGDRLLVVKCGGVGIVVGV